MLFWENTDALLDNPIDPLYEPCSPKRKHCELESSTLNVLDLFALVSPKKNRFLFPKEIVRNVNLDLLEEYKGFLLNEKYMSKDEHASYKKYKRQIKNRYSATKSRKNNRRKLAEYDKLKRLVTKLQKENKMLREQIKTNLK